MPSDAKVVLIANMYPRQPRDVPAMIEMPAHVTWGVWIGHQAYYIVQLHAVDQILAVPLPEETGNRTRAWSAWRGSVKRMALSFFYKRQVSSVCAGRRAASAFLGPLP